MRSLALVFLVTLSACSVITNPGRFESYKTFTLELRGFEPHINNRVDIKLVADVGATGNIEGWIRLEPLGAIDTTSELFDTIDPGRTYHVDFFADFNNSGTYDPPDVDHSWRIPVAPDGVARYTHDFQFTNFINFDPPNPPAPPMTHGDAHVVLTNANALEGMKLEARIYNPISENVGYYRRAELPAGDVDFTVPSIIDAGSTYAIDLFINDMQCAPRIEVTAGANLEVSRDARDFSCQ